MFFIIDGSLDIVSKISREEVHPCKPTYIRCLSESTCENEFLLAVSAKPDASQYLNSYRGKFSDDVNL